MTINAVINRLVDFTLSKEAYPPTPDEGVADPRDIAVAAVARWIAAQGPIERPAAGKRSRWASIDDLKTHAQHAGPNITMEQIDLAVAAALEGTNLAEPPRPVTGPNGLPVHRFG
jgi:hypothetical protein